MSDTAREAEDAVAIARGDDAYERSRHDVPTCEIMPGAIVT
ncbi:hypothetical protein [Pandoraea sp. NPDC087047]